MKNKLLLSFFVLLIICSFHNVFAQETEDLPLNRRFPLTKISDPMNQYAPAAYYRFSPDVLFFDQIDLSYFPHELWTKDQWTLLGRWSDGNTYSQMIYSDTPAAKKMMHGTDVGESRATGAYSFPANFMLVAAMNPCPCGYYGDPTHSCTCSDFSIQRYQKRISGPLLDRIDIRIDVPRVEYEKLSSDTVGESSASIRERVEAARERQRVRFAENPNVTCNSEMGPAEIRQYCRLDTEGEKLVKHLMTHYQISARAYHRLLKLARTIADLDASPVIQTRHMAEAIQYRPRTNG